MTKLIFNIFKKAAFPLRGRHLNRFYVVRIVLNLLLRLIKPTEVMVDGNRFYLDKDDSMRLSILGVYEPATVKHFWEAVKPGSVVLDIGAHIGYYTVMAAKRVGSRGKVYAFEPSKENLVLLNKNIKINKFKNVISVNKAVSDSTKKVKFYINPISTGMNSLVNIGYKGERSITVDAISLDDFFGKKLPKVSVIKMDIEGGEFSALKGMRNLLKKSTKLSLFTEFSPFSIKKANQSPEGFLSFLRDLGFKLYSIDEATKQLLQIRIKEFIASCPDDSDWHVNLLATK